MAGLSFDDLIPEGKEAKSVDLFEDLVPARDVGTQPIDASTVYVDELLFGVPGKAASGLNALVRAPFTDKTIAEEYETLRNQYRNARAQYAEENPIANAAASIGGAIQGGATGAGYAGQIAGRTLAPLAARVAPNLTNRIAGSYLGAMGADAASGAAQGAASAFGHDEDPSLGAIVGGGIGFAARPVISAGSQALSSIGGLIGVGNTARARNALAEAVRRSGMTPRDVATELAAARAAGQTQYTAADVLGNAGQRMLTGVVRSPGDERQAIVEALQARQAGQGRRIQGFLEEAFGSPQTRQQTIAAQEALRQAEAGVNYGAARAAAGPVDPTAAITAADDFLTPGASGVMSNATNISDDSIESAVRRARGYLTDDKSVLTDFNAAFRAKRELDNMIEKGSRTVQSQLIPIRNGLDDALANASEPYANARDTFRRQSQEIAAADIGRNAALRGRIEDTIPEFNALVSPQAQQSYRAGYVDPLIESLQGTAGPMTNRARPLITDATAQEFPAFAIQGQGQPLLDRLSREQRMFETMNQALGGSRTAENLSDIADVGTFDPTLVGAIARGDIGGAALRGLGMGVTALQGRNTATRDAIARVLMEGDPTRARAALATAVKSGKKLSEAQQSVVRALIGSLATAEPKLIAD